MSDDVARIRALAEESFRHSWDMSDERMIDGAWVHGLCCECGEFVPYGQEVAHVTAALLDSPAFRALIAEAEQRGREDNADHGQCYVSGSAALAGLLARERAAAWAKGASEGLRTPPHLAWMLVNPHRAEAEEAGAS